MLRSFRLRGGFSGRYYAHWAGIWANRARIITAAVLVMLMQLVSSASHRLPISAGAFAEPAADAAPLAFVANSGQLDPTVHFQADALGGTVFFTADQVVLALPGAMPPAPTAGVQPLVVRLGFEGASPAVQLAGGQPLPERVHYLRGSDPARWRTGIATYAKMRYAGLYPGIDLHYSGTSYSIKSTFVVAAGADPAAIRWRYHDANVAIDRSGALALSIEGRPALTEQAPVAWQDIGGARIAVPVHYVLSVDQSISFELGSYDRAFPLIIDPILEYSSYLGGSDNDQVSNITRDAAGFLYLVGSTQSSNFPTVDPLQLASTSGTCSSAPEAEYPCRDIFITKLSPDGRTKLFSTYLSGNDHDYGNGIAVHSDGSIYIIGGTSSSDFPIVDPAQPVYKSGNCGPYPDHRRCQDMFIARLSGDGSELLFSTLIGGMRDDYGRSLAFGPQNDLYITGGTSSSDFPTAQPFQLRPTNQPYCYPNGTGDPYTCPDAFVLRMALDTHTLVFSTYLGGSLHDEGVALAVDAAGDAYVAGFTVSRDFPTARALIPLRGRGTCATWYYESCPDAFITKILSDGSQLAYSTYFGGDGFDRVGALAVNSAGEVSIAGQTNSTNLMLARPFQSTVRGNDAFAAKLSADGQTLRFGSYLGGSSNDYGYGLALDSAGNMYISGTTQSNNFPIAHPFQAANAGGTDVFVAKISEREGALLFSSYLGGQGNDQGYSLVLGEGGDVYVVGTTASDNFPTRDPFQPALAGAIDTFIAKLALPQHTLLTNRLLDDTTGLPIANAAGTLLAYQGTALFDRYAFTTDAAGVYTATLNAPLGPLVRLEYSGIPGYGRQYHDRQTSIERAEQVLLCACPTQLTTRLLPATTLANTLVDTLSGQPLGGVSGSLSVYSGTTILETVAFTANASGVYTATFTPLISQSVRLEYSGVSGYRRQFYDGRDSLERADLVTLVPGHNSLTTHMLEGTLLANTLVDAVSGAAVADTSGTLGVYSGTALLDQQSFTTSATGVYTLSFASLISQSVRLEYTLSGYPKQYYQRALTLEQADSVELRRGRNTLTTVLIPETTLVATLHDQVTGLPIASTSGSIAVYSGTVGLASRPFTTDASGVYTATFSIPISQSVRLLHGATGYLNSYYERKSTLAQSDPVALRYGLNTLATQLTPLTTLSNRLLNDASGLPIGNTSGSLRVYSGTTVLQNRTFTTDATGTYTMTFAVPISQSVWLGYEVEGFGIQYYDRKLALAQADPLALRAGSNTLTTRLLPFTTISNTLLDDLTGTPLRNMVASVSAYSGTTLLKRWEYQTDANGRLMLAFNQVRELPVLLEYRIAGYPVQYHDRQLTLGQAQPVQIGPGIQQLVTRLLAGPRLVNTLVDDETGEPIAYAQGRVTAFAAPRPLGYTWDDTVPFEWIDARTLGTNTGISTSYQRTFAGPLDIGFPFVFYGNTTQQLYVNTDGALSIDRPLERRNEGLANTPLPTADPYNNLIAPLWADFYQGIDNGDGIYTYQGGSAPNRYFVVEWYRTQAYLSGSVMTFEVILHENGDIVMQYLDLAGFNHRISVGLENVTGQEGVQYFFGTRGIKNNSAIRFTPSATPELAFLESQTFIADAQGVYTATLTSAVSRTVVLRYSDINAYARQFYDRKSTGKGAAELALAGRHTLTSRLIPATTLVNTLLDDATGLPIKNVSGFVSVYSGTTYLERQPFKTTDKGIFVATLSTPISQSVRLEYSEIAGYARQYHDRQPALVDADPVAVRTWTNLFTSRLMRSPQLVNQVLDDRTGAPVQNASGQLLVYAGAQLLEQRSVTTDASGVFTATLNVLLGQPLRLEYNLAGYPRQYYDRQVALAQASPVILAAGSNELTTRLLSAQLVNSLRDSVTGQPIGNAAGVVTLFAGNTELESHNVTTDASGTYTATLNAAIARDVRLRYAFSGYHTQFYDRKLQLSQADSVLLGVGSTTLDTALIPKTRVSGSLLDDVTGQPIVNATGSLAVYSGTLLLDQRAFTTNASGGYSMLFEVPLDQYVSLEFSVNSYPKQYYLRALTLASAVPVLLQHGGNSLNVRLVPFTKLVNSLRDANTGASLGMISGVLRVYSGTQQLDSQPFSTNSSGVYTVTFSKLISQSVQLRYTISGYPVQYYDGALQPGDATAVALTSGNNTLTTTLVRTVLVNTLLDNGSGGPLRNVNGRLNVYAGTQQLEGKNFTTDASGVYTTSFALATTQPVRLEYQVTGYARQYYQLKASLAQADPVALQLGFNTLSSRLTASSILVNTLRDDVTGQPIRNRSGTLAVYSGTLLLEQRPFTTNASGVYTATFTAPLSQSVLLQYTLDTYRTQYYDRALSTDVATPVRLAPGATMLTSRLLPATTLVNTLRDDVTGQLLGSRTGALAVYSGTLLLEQRAFTTSASGTYTVTFNTPLNQNVRLFYAVGGYPKQYYNRASSLSQAAPLDLHPGTTTLTTRLVPNALLVGTLLDYASGEPIRNTYGAVVALSNGRPIESQGFTTSASGVYTVTFSGFISQTVQLAYLVDGYPCQYHNHQLRLQDAEGVLLRGGANSLTTQLAIGLQAPTSLVNTLRDDVTGQPIGNRTGTLAVYSGTQLLEQRPFSTDASGTFTATFTTPLSQSVLLQYTLDGYHTQYHDRALTPAAATPVWLAPGTAMLDTRLIPLTTLANTLRDDLTGLPVSGRAGTLVIYSGTLPLEQHAFTTDASGTFTITLAEPLSQPVRLKYQVGGYAEQYYDRQTSLAQADSVALQSGFNTLITRLEQFSSNSVAIPPNGGRLRLPDGSAELIFPSGAFSETVIVTYVPLSGPSSPLPGDHIGLRSFRLEARTRSGQVVTQTLLPYILMLDYRSAEPSAIAAQGEMLNVLAWRESRWQASLPCAGCSVDRDQQRMTVVLTHFTEFALVGRAQRALFLPIVIR